MLAKKEGKTVFAASGKNQQYQKHKQSFRSPRQKKTVPKIASREIPLHCFGMTLDSLSLPKSKKQQIRIWEFTARKKVKSEQQSTRRHYNRSVHLLHEYLERKQRHLFHPILIPNPQAQVQNSQNDMIKTANQFRIRRKGKRANAIDYHLQQENNICEIQANTLENQDKDFATFNSKNLYDMTVDELQESIQWKKSFLQTLTDNYSKAKTKQFFYRHYI